MDSYGRELAAIADQLRGSDRLCSVRGDGPARFVFAERGNRAAELSRSGDGWWVEFWAGETIAMEQTFPATEEAVLRVREWLTVTPPTNAVRLTGQGRAVAGVSGGTGDAEIVQPVHPVRNCRRFVERRFRAETQRTQRKDRGERETENEISGIVVDAAYKIHTTLGPGLLESVYEAVLAYERRSGAYAFNGSPHPDRLRGGSDRRGLQGGLIVEDKVIIELKAIDAVAAVHKKQLLTYLPGRQARGLADQLQCRPDQGRHHPARQQTPGGNDGLRATPTPASNSV
jgi:GxxExxY protein